MKTRFSSVFAKVALVAFALCLSSCNKEEDTTPVVGATSILGKWECTNVSYDNPPEGLFLFTKGDIITFQNKIFDLVHPYGNNDRGSWVFVDRDCKIGLRPNSTGQESIFDFYLDNERWELDLVLYANGQTLIHRFKRFFE